MNSARWLRGGMPLALIAMLAVAGCGGGGSSSGGEADDDISDLVLIDVNVGGTDGVALNQVIVFEFSEEVVGSSVSAATMQIRLSPANAWQVPGEYNISGNVIEFFPRLPTEQDLSDSGLKPGQTYQIRLPGHPKPNTLTNADGDALADTYKASFATAVASSPNLFIDYDPDETPHVISVNPKDGAVNVPQAVIPELNFSEPLDPSTVTVSNVTLTMTHRPPGSELDPPRPIQGHLIFEQNRASVILKFVNAFPLADNATYALRVDRRVSDLAGNDIVQFESSFTIRDEPPVPGSFTLDFGPGTETMEDTDITIASWNDDIPETLCAIFTAGAGTGVDGDFKASGNSTTLSSNVSTEWNFRSFTIPAGTTVKLVGSEPITILSLAKMEIAGTLLASGTKGGKGEANTYNTAIPKNPGSPGGPGGGKGGDAATKATYGTNGEDGYGTTGTGAGAPNWPSAYSTYRYCATGGSGGGHRTAGKAGKKPAYTYYTAPTPGKPGGTGGNKYCDPLTAGGGGSPGTVWGYSAVLNGPGSGGGGGGGVELRSANNIEILPGGRILAEGGGGGPPGSTYMSSPGGGGGGGAVLIRSLKDLIADGATISVKGGAGVSTGYYTYYIGASGAGGHGWLRLEDGDKNPSLSGATLTPNTKTTGTFTATGAGAPSIGQTLWMNMGVFDPIFLSSEVTQEIPKDGQDIKIAIEATVEDIFDFGMPDEGPGKSSGWIDIADIKDLNGKGYSFIRFRVTFTLASDQNLTHPMPYVDKIKIVYEY